MTPRLPMVEPHAPTGLVGREAELTFLHQRLERALGGERQVVFVTGEAGIGKSALVTAFLQQIAGDTDVWVARGQCIEHYGAGEAYLPVLEALGRLGREAGGQPLVRLLRQYAPTWLAHLPMLLSAPERAKAHQTTTGVTRERMLRELAEAVEMLTAQVGLVLWFEDVQWSDPSTLEWVGYIARRPGCARRLVVSTCRPVAMLEHEHPLTPLTQELFLHGQAVELGLRGITARAVADYLSWRLGHGRGSAALQTLAWAMHQRTEGNPLFILHVVEHLLAQGLRVPSDGQVALQDALTLVQRCVPQQIQQLIENQLARLSPEEQRLLAIASVAGAEFSAASVAAGLEIGVEEVEERCAGLAQRALFIQARGTTDWPDGTVATRYAFLHALYVHVLYERIPPGHRQAMHGRLAQRLEQAYGVHVRTVAAELALHFERGRHYDKAIHYLHQAGENASRLSAHTEAVRLLTNGLALLQTLPETPERLQQELSLQFALGPSLIVLKGYAAPEVEHLFTRTYALCHKVSDTRHLFAALVGLSGMYHNRAEYQRVRDLVGQMLCLAQETASSTRQLWAHVLMAQVLYQTGVFGRARMHYRQAMALYESRRHSPTVSDITQDPRVHCLANLAEVLWLRGYPNQALQHSQEAYTIAQRLAHPSSQVVALASATLVHSWRGEHRVASELAEALIALACEHGFPHWLAVGTIRRGVAVVAQGQPEAGMAQIRQGVAALQATGAQLGMPGYLCQLAWAHKAIGQEGEGLALIAEALTRVHTTGERLLEAELYRLQGELLQPSGLHRPVCTDTPRPTRPQTPDVSGEVSLLRAIKISRRQRAKSLELQAAMSLSRLWQQQGKQLQARQMLAQICGWFTEGLATADLQDAKVFLDILA